MTSPNTRQHASGAMPVMPWVIVAGMGLVFVVIAALWVAAAVAAGDGFTSPGYGQVPRALKNDGVVGLIGPQGSRLLFYGTLSVQAVLVLAATVAVAVLVTRRRRPRNGLQAMVSRKAFADLQQPEMAKRAQGLRPSLAETKTSALSAREIGAALGDVSGATLFKSHEDVELVICGPRSNKTSAKVVPDIIAAPGTVVATSNKPDVWVLTAGLRNRVGSV